MYRYHCVDIKYAFACSVIGVFRQPSLEIKAIDWTLRQEMSIDYPLYTAWPFICVMNTPNHQAK